MPSLEFIYIDTKSLHTFGTSTVPIKMQVLLKLRRQLQKNYEQALLNPFQPSVIFHVETSHFFAEQNKYRVSI